MPNESTPAAGEFLFYQTEDGKTRIECCFETEVDIEPRNKLYSLLRRKPFRRLTLLPRPALRRGPSCIRNPL